MYLFSAGVARVAVFVGDQLMLNANTLSASSINFSVSSTDVRGGDSNALYGRYFYDSALSVTLTDIMWDMKWLAMNTGSAIENGSSIFEDETVILTAGGNGTVTGTPIPVDKDGTIGWVSKPGENEWVKVTFSEKSFTIPGAEANDTYCVRYMTTNSAARRMVISSTFIPQTVKLVMTGRLYAGSESATPTYLGENGTIAGKFEVIIPRFQFAGTQELALTSTGVSNTPMTGAALAVQTADCSNAGMYAIISEWLNNAKWYDNVLDIAVAGGNIEMTTGTNQVLSVRAVPKSGAAYSVANSNFTFMSKNSAVASVDNTGTVNALTAGETAITVTVTDKPELEGIAYITVT